MRLIQYEIAVGESRVGVVDDDRTRQVSGVNSTYELAQAAIAAGRGAFHFCGT